MRLPVRLPPQHHESSALQQKCRRYITARNESLFLFSKGAFVEKPGRKIKGPYKRRVNPVLMRKVKRVWIPTSMHGISTSEESLVRPQRIPYIPRTTHFHPGSLPAASWSLMYLGGGSGGGGSGGGGSPGPNFGMDIGIGDCAIYSPAE